MYDNVVDDDDNVDGDDDDDEDGIRSQAVPFCFLFADIVQVHDFRWFFLLVFESSIVIFDVRMYISCLGPVVRWSPELIALSAQQAVDSAIIWATHKSLKSL